MAWVSCELPNAIFVPTRLVLYAVRAVTLTADGLRHLQEISHEGAVANYVELKPEAIITGGVRDFRQRAQ
jgi:hypothetical protein